MTHQGEVEMFEDMVILDPAYPIPLLYEEPFGWFKVVFFFLVEIDLVFDLVFDLILLFLLLLSYASLPFQGGTRRR